MKMVKPVCTLLLILTILYLVNADLSVLGRKECGQITCKEQEYCSSIDRICRTCSSICDPGNHNLREDECRNQCQDYLHDIRYQRKLDAVEDIYNEVRRLTTISTLALAISSLALLGILAMAAILYLHITKKLDKLRKKKMAKERIKIDYVNPNAPLDSRNKITETKITKPNDVSISIPEVTNSNSTSKIPETPKTEYTTISTISKTVANASCDSPTTNNFTNQTTPPLSSRHPSEDNTLGYAYDNHGLAPSPTLDINQVKKK